MGMGGAEARSTFRLAPVLLSDWRRPGALPYFRTGGGLEAPARRWSAAPPRAAPLSDWRLSFFRTGGGLEPCLTFGLAGAWRPPRGAGAPPHHAPPHFRIGACPSFGLVEAWSLALLSDWRGPGGPRAALERRPTTRRPTFRLAPVLLSDWWRPGALPYFRTGGGLEAPARRWSAAPPRTAPLRAGPPRSSRRCSEVEALRCLPAG